MSISDPHLSTEPDPMISYDLLNEKGIAQSKCAARLCRGSHSLNVSVRRKPNSYHRMLIWHYLFQVQMYLLHLHLQENPQINQQICLATNQQLVRHMFVFHKSHTITETIAKQYFLHQSADLFTDIEITNSPTYCASSIALT